MPAATAITIGNFDGVHLGHAELVRTARNTVGESGRVVVLSFDPHPFTRLRPEAVPARLSTFTQRTHWLEALGADTVDRLEPSAELLSQSPQQFLENIAATYRPNFIVEGSDFHFGNRRSGSVDTLRELEPVHGYRTIVVGPVQAALADQSVVQVGSSLIRWLLERGRVRDAAILLGRHYELVSEVVRGDQRGRTISMPTINLAATDSMLPADGIYAGFANGPDGTIYPAAISVGTKPTFGNLPRVCEAHLIGYRGPVDDYGWPVRLHFHDWIRDQLTFSDIDQLIQQLQRDVACITRLLSPSRTIQSERAVIDASSSARPSLRAAAHVSSS